jgi:hypothetical protein
MTRKNVIFPQQRTNIVVLLSRTKAKVAYKADPLYASEKSAEVQIFLIQ